MSQEWREILIEQYEILKKRDGGIQRLLPCLPDDEDREFITELMLIESRGTF